MSVKARHRQGRESVVAELAKIAKITRDRKEIAQVGPSRPTTTRPIGSFLAEPWTRSASQGVITVEEAQA
jgi:chaperonin GroEL